MRVLFYLIWLILLTVLQPTLARDIEIFRIAPNLFLCFVIMTSFFRGKTEGAICGLIFGLVYDLLIGRMIGVNCISYLYVGFGAGWLSEQFFSGGKRIGGVIGIFCGTLLAAIIYYFTRLSMYHDIRFVTAFFRIGILEAIYNSVIGFLLSFPILWLMKPFRMEKIS